MKYVNPKFFSIIYLKKAKGKFCKKENKNFIKFYYYFKKKIAKKSRKKLLPNIVLSYFFKKI